MPSKIPVTVIVTTLNEERNLPRCLAALERFDEIIVIDSNSADATQEIARSFGASVVPFTWNGRYPKKRQWCLDTLPLKHDRIFFVDGDEEVTPALCDEIATLDWKASGYFVKGVYVVKGKTLRFGLNNSKLCLFDRKNICFPVVDDLDIPGMGEIEGHYQPVLKKPSAPKSLGRLNSTLLHHALDDVARHAQRHDDYALWGKSMQEKRAFPTDPRRFKRGLKAVFARFPAKILIFFTYYYFIRLGVLEYPDNLEIYRQKLKYYTNTVNRKAA